jgi:hypothetical protein
MAVRYPFIKDKADIVQRGNDGRLAIARYACRGIGVGLHAIQKAVKFIGNIARGYRALQTSVQLADYCQKLPAILFAPLPVAIF